MGKALSVVPVKQELTEQKSGKIDQAPEKELKGVLKYVMVKIGLRAANWPSDEEKGVLLMHIIEHYGNNTIEDIKTAFDLAITGQTEVDANCFENFSCLYFSKIMNAYVKSLGYLRKTMIEKWQHQIEFKDTVAEKCQQVYQLVLLMEFSIKAPLTTKWPKKN